MNTNGCCPPGTCLWRPAGWASWDLLSLPPPTAVPLPPPATWNLPSMSNHAEVMSFSVHTLLQDKDDERNTDFTVPLRSATKLDGSASAMSLTLPLEVSLKGRAINGKFCTWVRKPWSPRTWRREEAVYFSYDISLPTVPAKSTITQCLFIESYRTAAKCPGSRQTDRCLTVEGLDRVRFSSPGDSYTEVFISKPTLKLAFVADKGKALLSENLPGNSFHKTFSLLFSPSWMPTTSLTYFSSRQSHLPQK